MKYWKYIIIITLGLLVLILIIFTSENKISKLELISLKYNGSFYIIPPKDMRRMLNESKKNSEISIQKDFEYLLRVVGEKTTDNYYFSQPGVIYNKNEDKWINATPQLNSVLENAIRELEKQTPFGELLDWNEVDGIFPRMAKAKLRDLDTGLVLNIQRRGGSAHADVQPLSAQDTATLKQIYNGHWSWKRRAAILEIGNYKIAASMNGMPHGQGAIQNNFPGHFCLHFSDTRTHSGNSDLAHALMTRKAAGCIGEYLMDKTAREMVEIALTSVAQNDPLLVAYSFVLEENIGELLEYMKKIASLKMDKIEEVLPNEFTVAISWYETGKGENIKKEFAVIVDAVEGNKFLVRPAEIINAFLKQ
ncbi:MAG: hypothetical protein ACOYVD_01355 [Bacillota bacterium]